MNMVAYIGGDWSCLPMRRIQLFPQPAAMCLPMEIIKGGPALPHSSILSGVSSYCGQS